MRTMALAARILESKVSLAIWSSDNDGAKPKHAKDGCGFFQHCPSVFFRIALPELPKSSDLGRKCRMPFRVPVTMERNRNMHKIALVFSNHVQVFFFRIALPKVSKSSDLGRKCRMPFRVPVTIERNRNMHKIAGVLANTVQVFFFESDFIECLSQAMP